MEDNNRKGKGKKVGDIAEYLEPDEMDKLLNVVVGDLYYSALYNTLKQTGRRIGEIYGTYREGKLIGGVQVKDIDFDRNQIKTSILKTRRKQKKIKCSNCNYENTNKDNFCSNCGTKIPEELRQGIKVTKDKEIVIPMKQELSQLLEKYVKEKNKYRDKERLGKSDYIFREVPLVTLKKKIKQHAKQAGIKKNISLHSFRRYFITQCKKSGMTNEDIAKWTGHVLPSTINTYDSRIPDDIREQIENVRL